jgi:hypothetical protein
MRFYRSPGFAAALVVLLTLAGLAADLETYWP